MNTNCQLCNRGILDNNMKSKILEVFNCWFCDIFHICHLIQVERYNFQSTLGLMKSNRLSLYHSIFTKNLTQFLPYSPNWNNNENEGIRLVCHDFYRPTGNRRDADVEGLRIEISPEIPRFDVQVISKRWNTTQFTYSNEARSEKTPKRVRRWLSQRCE